jgi:hypothetical protein
MTRSDDRARRRVPSNGSDCSTGGRAFGLLVAVLLWLVLL